MQIREFREKHKLSGMKLASMLGVERQTIYNWESGKSRAPEFLERALNDWDRELSPKEAIEGKSARNKYFAPKDEK